MPRVIPLRPANNNGFSMCPLCVYQNEDGCDDCDDGEWFELDPDFEDLFDKHAAQSRRLDKEAA